MGRSSERKLEKRPFEGDAQHIQSLNASQMTRASANQDEILRLYFLDLLEKLVSSAFISIPSVRPLSFHELMAYSFNIFFNYVDCQFIMLKMTPYLQYVSNYNLAYFNARCLMWPIYHSIRKKDTLCSYITPVGKCDFFCQKWDHKSWWGSDRATKEEKTI